MGGGGGGGGSTDIQELDTGDIRPFYQFQQNQLNRYWNHSPLLSAARTNALNYNRQLPGLMGTLDSSTKYYSDIAASGGKASAQELRNVDQSSLTGMSDTHSLGALGTELLNRDQFTQARMGMATGQLEGLAQMRQGLQTGGLNQLTGTQGAATGTFTQLQNPILQVPLANLQARIAQAQVNEQANQASQSKQAGGMSSIMSTVGSIAGAAAMFASDERLKEDVADTGLRTMDGIPLKTFRYKGGDKKYLGAMAQDVEKVKPDAVSTDLLTGFKFVDLSKAGIPMAQVA